MKDHYKSRLRIFEEILDQICNLDNNVKFKQNCMSEETLKIKIPKNLTFLQFLHHQQIIVEPFKQASTAQDNLKIMHKLMAMVPSTTEFYPNTFVIDFLLVKLNSWLKYSHFNSKQFITTLSLYYNSLQQHVLDKYKYSRNDGQLLAQILLKSEAYKCIQLQDLNQILDGSGLMICTIFQAIRRGNKILQKGYCVITIGMVSLHGRSDPYLSIVHEEKQHFGQIQFAAKINSLIHFDPKVQKIHLDIVQDAYSLRCSPQVQGVFIDCLNQLKNQVEQLLKKPQTTHIFVNNKKIRNLALRSQTETYLIDNLLFSLNEIGHMSFLRAERVLNKHLGKNQIHLNEHYQFLMANLKKVSYLVSENKLLSIPSNADTILMNNYIHDVYVSEGNAFRRLNAMMDSTQKIFNLELMAGLQAIYSIRSKQDPLFLNEQMENNYKWLLHLRSSDPFLYAQNLQKWIVS